MRKFKIAIVERGKEALWRDYWITSDSEGNAEVAPSELGRTEVVEQQASRRQSMPFDVGTQIAQ